MASVYTETFLATNTPGTTTYYVPAGMRAIVRSVSAANRGAGTATLQVGVAGTVAVQSLVQAGPKTELYELRAVAYAGEDIWLYVDSASVSGIVSGFLFADTTGRTAPPAGAGGKPLPHPPD